MIVHMLLKSRITKSTYVLLSCLIQGVLLDTYLDKPTQLRI